MRPSTAIAQIVTNPLHISNLPLQPQTLLKAKK